ncbi:CPBP family intramembrane metalloprotease [Anaerocolumna sedimenticola]|uniref:CPBP family intramembrane metalloprotease n=1 Tax=Anaerocolumna sedimenticola TaxID=2696063 RepID=A0A6P1TSQ5_9FIRM|nr:CPBP family intramembrane glutamic endopeptidase [Anaerocolumna sedimenticola]QHQ63387.1 CPBP family intramembrane metalloprotease [Anaerocolumna sedimenticola]
MKKIFGNIINFLKIFLMFAMLFITITVISSVCFSMSTKLFNQFSGFDPDNCFLLLTIHHILQAIITTIIIVFISIALKIPLKDFGFNTKNFRYSIKMVQVFCFLWIMIQTGGSILLIKMTSMSAALTYPLTFKNFLGYFLFEILFTGTSEELLFRSLTIPVMLFSLNTFLKSEQKSQIIAISASTLIFMLAHINFNLNPFKITYFNLLQQITCFIFGTFFGWLFIKSKSVLGPMFAHNLLNGIITIVGFIMYIIFG